MPPTQQPQPQALVVTQASLFQSRYIAIGVVVGGIALVTALLIYIWPRSDEAIVAAFSCADGLSWDITTGQTMSDTYGGQIDAKACEYHRAELFKGGEKVFSVANFTDCRDFKSNIDLLNGIDEPFYESHQAFPAGAPIVAAVTVPSAVVPQNEPAEFGNATYQLGFQISTKSGLTPQEFIAASKCILDHRNELHDTFGSLHDNSGPLEWLALVDETASYGSGDLPGGGQVYACQNGFIYRTSGESLFSLAAGEPAQKSDEYGFSVMNDRQVAVIGFDGRLYEPDRTNSALYLSLPYADHRLVAKTDLPVPLSSCQDDRGRSLQEYLDTLKNNVVYEPPTEDYVAQPVSANTSEDSTNMTGIAPTAEQNADCESRYASTISSAANDLVGQGEVSAALFYSPSLSICVGVIQTIQGNSTNYWTFDAATGANLNASKTATAFQDWSLSPPSRSISQ